MHYVLETFQNFMDQQAQAILLTRNSSAEALARLGELVANLSLQAASLACAAFLAPLTTSVG